MSDVKAFLIRLRPETYDVLHKVAHDQRRSKASVIESLIREHLQPRHGDVRQRIDQLLARR
jgi:hypothetical protein